MESKSNAESLQSYSARTAERNGPHELSPARRREHLGMRLALGHRPFALACERRNLIMIANFDRLLTETARAFDVTTEGILGPTRHKTMALARQVVMALWSDHHAFQDATNRVNRTCHNTAMYARERVLNRAELDPNFARIVAGIAARCQHTENPSNPMELESEPMEKIA